MVELLDGGPAADPVADDSCRGMDPGLDVVTCRKVVDGIPNEFGRVAAVGKHAWWEMRSCPVRIGEAIDAEGLPVEPLEGPGDEVPAATQQDESVGIDVAFARIALAREVREPKTLAIATRLGDGRQRAGVCARGVGPEGDRHGHGG